MIPRFTPINDDQPEFDSVEFQAGYDARMAGEQSYTTATRSWRAGWADADATCMDAAERAAAYISILAWLQERSSVYTPRDLEAIFSTLGPGLVRQALTDLERTGKLYVCDACSAIISKRTSHNPGCSQIVQ